MMTGPTLGGMPEADNQKKIDDLQLIIADMTENRDLKGLIYSFNDFINLPGEFNRFSDNIRDGKYASKEEVVAELKKISLNTLRALGKMTDAKLKTKDTDYQSSRWALIGLFYGVAKIFGVQVELSKYMNDWEKDSPHSEDPKEQTFQEQKEAAFKQIDRRFVTMYKTVTDEVGFDSESKILEGCMRFVHEVMMGHVGPVANYFGMAENFTLDENARTKRTEILKEKLGQMVKESLLQDARKATEFAFKDLATELFPKPENLKGKTAADVANEIISKGILPKLKSKDLKFAGYRPLRYYIPHNKKEHNTIVLAELHQNLVYLARMEWGPYLTHDKRAEDSFKLAQMRVEGDPQYFSASHKPGSVDDGDVDDTSPTLRQGKGALQAELSSKTPVPEISGVSPKNPAYEASSGEGASVHDVDTLRKQLAARAVQTRSGTTVPAPEHVTTEHSQPSIIIDPSVMPTRPLPVQPVPQTGVDQNRMPTIPDFDLPKSSPVLEIALPPADTASSQRNVKTMPPSKGRIAASKPDDEVTQIRNRPTRPDVQLVKKDEEVTQPDAQRKALAQKGGFMKWAKRSIYAAAAALGITALGVGYQAYKANNSTDNKTGSSEVGKQKDAPAVPSTVAQTPTATASVAASAAPTASETPAASTSAPVAVTQVPTVDLKGSSAAAAPDVQPKAPEVAAVLGSYSYGMGNASGAKALPSTVTPSAVEGGVDATPFVATLKSSTWYETQQKAADTLLKIDPARLDKDTAEYVKGHEKMLRDLASQTNFNPLKFKASFENHYGSNELFGAKGVYNELLGMERILDLYGGNAERLVKDKTLVTLTVGAKVNAPEQRFAKAVMFKADPVSAPVQQNGGSKAPQPKDAPQKDGGRDNNGKSGFNGFTPDSNNPFGALPGIAPSDAVVPLRYASAVSLESNDLDAAFKAFNNDRSVKEADQKTAVDYKVTKETLQYVAEEDHKVAQFEAARRSRGFFSKLADAASYAWSGTTPEDKAQGLKGGGGIRGYFMTETERLAELQKRAEIMAAAEKKIEAPAVVPAITAVPAAVTSSESKAQSIVAENGADAAIKKIRILQAKLDQQKEEAKQAEAAKAQASLEKKQALRAELDGKMEKLFARTRQMEAERAKAPAIDIQKTYKVAAADKSIKFVLERQIKESRLSDEAKEKSLVAVQEMIRSNGAFIEGYKMHSDGSRELTLKEEWRDKLNTAAGIEVATEIKDEDIIEVTEAPMAKAA